jgi:hypothetical protein
VLAGEQGDSTSTISLLLSGQQRPLLPDTENWLAGFLCLALTLTAWKRCTCRQAARDCQLGW